MIKKIFSLTLSLVLFGVFIMSSQSAFADDVKNYYFASLSSKIKILSRAVVTENGVEADFAGGGVSFKAKCSGDVSLTLDYSGAKGMIAVVINGDFDKAQNIKIEKTGEQSIVIAKNLSLDNYVFEITKVNSYYTNQVAFKSVSFVGELLEKPSSAQLKLEFYGDSITAGVGTLSAGIDGGDEVGYEDNSLYSYANYCARDLKAEISFVGMPGYGYLCGYDTGRGQNVLPYMSRALYNKENAFDNSSYIADVVILALGTNDSNYVKNHEEIVEKYEMCNVVQYYIDKVRSYNKHCAIVLIGSMTKEDLDVKSKRNGKYIRISYALKRAAAINEKVLYLDKLEMSTTGRGYHPKAQEAKLGGETLADFINENILSGKPFPEIVAPSDYYLNCDLNDDDKVNVTDVKRMADYLVNNNRYKLDDKITDVNCDGSANLKDYLKLRKTVAEQD